MEINQLEILREEINQIDVQLVELLVKRANVALQIADQKRNSVDVVEAKGRVEIVLSKVRELALNFHGDDKFIESVYKVIIHELTQMQLIKKGLINHDING
ncbi:chorismate mutase [Photobacterium sp. CCB-ST2H9]|uniref:chorismate mutase n=1 Tax=unclassified Photobacterium TaxID=2628852 RepID=UPI0020059E23|nr:chorismate mutase [Photobacterium sp. CCB-ST2H9]UTM58643.1 chorismate mutase [Photobacterium sp. CCB-ST2H9]